MLELEHDRPKFFDKDFTNDIRKVNEFDFDDDQFNENSENLQNHSFISKRIQKFGEPKTIKLSKRSLFDFRISHQIYFLMIYNFVIYKLVKVDIN